MAKGAEVIAGLNVLGVVAVVLLLVCCPPVSWCFVWVPFFIEACKSEKTQ